MPALINNNEIEEVIRLLQVDPQGAIDEAKRLLNRSGNTRDAVFVMLSNLMAASALRLDNSDLAEKYLTDGLLVDRSPHLLNTMAGIYRARGDHAQGLLNINEAIALAGDHAEFHRTKAILLFEGARYIELRQFLDRELTYFPALIYLRHLYTGGMDWREGDFSAGKRNLEKAIELEPTSSEAYFDLAQLYKAQGEHQSVIGTLLRLREFCPQLSEVQLAELAEAYRETGDLSQAADIAQQVLAINAANLFANITLAQVDATNGRKSNAIDRLNRLLQHDLPDHLQPQVYRNLGGIQEVDDDYENAFTSYKWANIADKRRINNLEEHLKASEDLASNSHRFPAYFKTLSGGVIAGSNHNFIISLPGNGSNLLAELLGEQSGVESHSNNQNILGLLAGTLPEESNPQQLAELNHDGQNVYWDPRFIFMLPQITLRFPEANIIWLTQHPKAVCLDVFTAAHDLTAYTAPFLAWQSTVDWISAMLTGWFTFAQQETKHYHQLAFETFVSNPGVAVKPLLEFLNLESEPSVSDNVLRRCQEAHQKSNRWISYPPELTPYTRGFLNNCTKLGFIEQE
jgi:tetratricopeptide (TPR) repeat protein